MSPGTATAVPGFDTHAATHTHQTPQPHTPGPATAGPGSNMKRPTCQHNPGPATAGPGVTTAAAPHTQPPTHTHQPGPATAGPGPNMKRPTCQHNPGPATAGPGVTTAQHPTHATHDTHPSGTATAVPAFTHAPKRKTPQGEPCPPPKKPAHARSADKSTQDNHATQKTVQEQRLTQPKPIASPPLQPTTRNNPHKRTLASFFSSGLPRPKKKKKGSQ